MRIATYNVNGINGRLGNLRGWYNRFTLGEEHRRRLCQVYVLGTSEG